MSRMSGAEAMVRMLQLHGVKHIFGLCGDTSLPFYDALARLDHGMQHILTRDERSAAYMADGYARVSGRVGVCEGPSGGGATYLLPGIVEANESSIPVLGITTDIATTSRGRYTLTELDQEALYRPLTKRSEVIDRADRLPEGIGLRHTEPGPSTVSRELAVRWLTPGEPGSIARARDALAGFLTRYVDVVLPRVPRLPLPLDPLLGEALRQEPAARAPGPRLLQRLAGHGPSDGSPALPLRRPDRRRPALRRGGDAPGRQGPLRRADQRAQRRLRAGRRGDATAQPSERHARLEERRRHEGDRHERRRVCPARAPAPVHQDQPALTAAFLDEQVDGDARRVVDIVSLLVDEVR